MSHHERVSVDVLLPGFLMRFIKGAGFIFVKWPNQHGVICLTVTTPVRSHIAPVSLGCQPVMVPFQPPCFFFCFFFNWTHHCLRGSEFGSTLMGMRFNSEPTARWSSSFMQIASEVAYSPNPSLVLCVHSSVECSVRSGILFIAARHLPVSCLGSWHGNRI